MTGFSLGWMPRSILNGIGSVRLAAVNALFSCDAMKPKKPKPRYTLLIELRGPRRKVINRIKASGEFADFQTGIDRTELSRDTTRTILKTTIQTGGVTAQIEHGEREFYDTERASERWGGEALQKSAPLVMAKPNKTRKV